MSFITQNFFNHCIKQKFIQSIQDSLGSEHDLLHFFEKLGCLDQLSQGLDAFISETIRPEAELTKIILQPEC